MTRVLLYSAESRGASDIDRLLHAALGAEALVDLAVLVLSDAPARDGFRLGHGIYQVHLPSAASPFDDEITALRTRLIMDAVREFKPDAILVDTAPRAVAVEITRSLDYARQYLPQTSVVRVVPGNGHQSEPATTSTKDGAADDLYDRVLPFH
jgi:predicted glycosyltransferase